VVCRPLYVWYGGGGVRTALRGTGWRTSYCGFRVGGWRLKQNYLLDLQLIRRGRLDDEARHFAKKPATLAVCCSVRLDDDVPSSSLVGDCPPGTTSPRRADS